MFSVFSTARGERVLYCSFEESSAALGEAMKSPGIDVDGAVSSGSLRVLTAMPESMGIEEHLFRIFDAVDSFEPAHLVLDSISATVRMGSEAAAFDFLVRIVGHAKQRGITCIFTSQTRSNSGIFGLSEVGISSLIDAIVSLDYDAVGSELRRTLLVVKNRGASHSHRYHRFGISDKGIHIEVGMENER
jgi:circadian clock protein KaiC